MSHKNFLEFLITEDLTFVINKFVTNFKLQLVKMANYNKSN